MQINNENMNYYKKSKNNLFNNTNLKNEKNTPLNSLFEVEQFLSNLKNLKKSINIYKLFKN